MTAWDIREESGWESYTEPGQFGGTLLNWRLVAKLVPQFHFFTSPVSIFVCTSWLLIKPHCRHSFAYSEQNVTTCYQAKRPVQKGRYKLGILIAKWAPSVPWKALSLTHTQRCSIHCPQCSLWALIQSLQRRRVLRSNRSHVVFLNAACHCFSLTITSFRNFLQAFLECLKTKNAYAQCLSFISD